MSSAAFVDLLAQYKMTFYWGAVDKKWWIIGQPAHGCNQHSAPEPAENYNAAQEAALIFIRRKYKLSK